MPTDACNLACSYCYVLKKPETRMSTALVNRVVDQILQYNDPRQVTRFIWHGGEPLLAGIAFYHSVCSYIHTAYPEHQVEHLLQTNGMLLKGAWVDFLLAEGFKIGVSLDGWQALHDTHRRTREGLGSFEIVFRNVQEARAKGLITGFICVLTRQSLSHVREIYEFFRDHAFDFSFHGVTSLTPKMVDCLSITPTQFAQASIELVDLGFYQPEPRVTDVNPSMHYIRSILLGRSSGYCVMAQTCAQEYLSVEPNGSVSVCDRFAGTPELSYGNIAELDLTELLQSPVRQKFLERWEMLSQGPCRDCEWSAICHGGCPHEAWVRNGAIDAPDGNCEAYQQIFHHVRDLVARELNREQVGA
jgi:uncharacterized protein